MDDVLVAAGGIIPDADVVKLKEAGVAEIFGPGTSIGADRALLPRARPAGHEARRDPVRRWRPMADELATASAGRSPAC